MAGYCLAIDQGTTSSRAILFDDSLKVVSVGQQEFAQHFPKSGWVEHDPEDIWETTLSTARQAISEAGVSAGDIAAIGITNQRETTIVWDRETGKPVYNAIVWQDRRTADVCAGLKAEGHEDKISQATGLLLDPYFSGTKIAWILDNVEGMRQAAEAGKLAFGTVDCFLLWRLTNGRVHATDATNASRTMLYDIRHGEWSDELLALLNVPRSMMPDVRDSSGLFGEVDEVVLGAVIPVTGIAGDQQAATVGQACFKPGMMKSTYGTGCFALLNTGAEMIRSQNRLLTTIAYQLDGVPTYALEGSIFIAGAAVQWLRDGLGLLEKADQSGPMAEAADPNQAIYLVPAFTGLGAPYWDAECRGALYGLTRGTGPNEIACAALEAVCYQTHDLLSAMKRDWGADQRTGEGSDPETILRVDGGMVASDWTMQRLSDLLDVPVDRPHVLETTALGAAWLAGRAVNLYPDQSGFSDTWALERQFVPDMNEAVREKKLVGWKDAVRRTLTD